MRILLVEDSPRLQKSICTAMRRKGFALDSAMDGEDGLWHAESVEYDTIILDRMLPKLDGISVLKRLRAGGKQTPVLLLTARDSIEDRVEGLNSGADDYLVKPFALEELVARVNALCRRRYEQPSAEVAVGNLILDTAAKRVLKADDHKEVQLNPREYALLEFLVLRRGKVVSRTEIEEHIYDGNVDPMSNVIDSAICVLRRKLAESEASPEIVTRRGVGYILEAS
jgi:DNA-binding response OmpR family regulator